MADFRPETLSVLTAAVPFVISTRFTILPAGPYAPPDTADQLSGMEAGSVRPPSFALSIPYGNRGGKGQQAAFDTEISLQFKAILEGWGLPLYPGFTNETNRMSVFCPGILTPGTSPRRFRHNEKTRNPVMSASSRPATAENCRDGPAACRKLNWRFCLSVQYLLRKNRGPAEPF